MDLRCEPLPNGGLCFRFRKTKNTAESLSATNAVPWQHLSSWYVRGRRGTESTCVIIPDPKPNNQYSSSMKLLVSLLATIVIAFLASFHVDALQISESSHDFSSSRRKAFRRMVATVASGAVTTGATRALAAEEAQRTSTSIPATSSVLIPGGTAPYRPQGIGSWRDIPDLGTKLGESRILATELSPLQQAFVGDKDLYYPQFMFGSWNVKAELKRKIYPYSIDFLPSSTLLNGSPRNRDELVGNVCNYEVHYFSTLPTSTTNQIVMNLGTSAPESKIVQDRGFNAISLSRAYEQLVPVQEVIWDYLNKPDKVVLDFGAAPLTADMRPLGPRRAEVFLNARATETSPDGKTFVAAERSRSVTVAVRDVLVSDTETITEFQQLDDDNVRAISRIAVYLSPNPNSKEGIMWQQTGGKAVAFFDYQLELKRIKESITLPDGSTESRTCITTPKGVRQCAEK